MSINKLILEQLNKSHVNYGEYDAIHHSFTIGYSSMNSP